MITLGGCSGSGALRDVALWNIEELGATARLKEAVSLLDQTLEEEKKTDALLSKLAQSEVNAKAA